MQGAARSVVLVHGAWHGPWCWQKVVDGLGQAGISAAAVELPLQDGLEADAAVVREAIAAIGWPVVACGHSYGGMVISRACSGLANVEHLVYLCAFQLTEAEDTTTILRAYPTALPEAIRADASGRIVDPQRCRELFYSDCSDADVALALANLRPMPAAAPVPAPARPAWLDVPSTYVVCSEDRAINPDGQAMMAARASRSVTWDTSHSPFFSRPELVVGLLAGLAHG